MNVSTVEIWIDTIRNTLLGGDFYFTTDMLPLIFSIISVMVALVGSSPILIQAWIYRRLDSGIDIDLQIDKGIDMPPGAKEETEKGGIEWWRLSKEELIERAPEDGTTTMPRISFPVSTNKNDIYVDKIEIRQNRLRWQFREDLKPIFSEITPQRAYVNMENVDAEGIRPNNISRASEVGFFPGNFGHSLPLPFEPEPSEGEIEIIIHTSVDAEEIELPIIGPLPRFFGRINLRPQKQTYQIKSS